MVSFFGTFSWNIQSNHRLSRGRRGQHTRGDKRGAEGSSHEGARDWQRNAQPTTLMSFHYVATAEMICIITMSEYCGKRGYTEDVCRTPQAEDRSHLVCDYCTRSVHKTKQWPIRGAEARKERLFRTLQSEANQQPPHYTWLKSYQQ